MHARLSRRPGRPHALISLTMVRPVMNASIYSPAFVALVAARGPLTHKLLWRALPAAERKHAAAQLLADTESPWARPALVDFLARVNKGFRRPTIAAWSNEKLADEIGRKPLEDAPLIDTLLKALHFPERAFLQAAFFDAAGIPHSNGMIEGDALPQPATSPEVLTSAAAALLAAQPGDAALYYLLCISTLEPAAWPTLQATLRELVPAG